MSFDSRLEQFQKKMDSSMDKFSKDLSGIRAGRASIALLEPIKVEAYGSFVMINQIGAISAPDAKTLSVNVWDKGLVKAVEKAIRDSGANLNPTVDGQIIRVPLPPLSEERRKELSKLASKYTEDAKVAIRNIRRDAMEFVKQLEKNNEISEDEMRKLSASVQEITDNSSKQIDSMLSTKQKDIMQV
ncbi:MAG: ribosome recycling factor [Holosporales bacterium]|jgi:ribosome recycling factor|nr:ribosome recycling factor [Holosporales bacterium]